MRAQGAVFPDFDRFFSVAKRRYAARMFVTLRTQLLMALGLSCAFAPAIACTKNDPGVTGVGNEATKKPPPPAATDAAPTPKAKKEFVPSSTKYSMGSGSCPIDYFCTNEPDRTQQDPKDLLPGKNDTPLYKECGYVTKIPASVAEKEFVGTSAGFSENLTEQVRKDEPDTCCFAYKSGPCGKGRPLRHEGAPVLAREIPCEGWHVADRDASVVAAEVRAIADALEIEHFTAHLRAVALLEHASVAAFARVSLELLALGAPSDLVTAAHVAAMDEIRHAQLCWSILAALEGTPHGPSPMTLPPMTTVDPDAVLVATVIDGCLGETLGSLLFHESARSCASPSLAAVYRSIAEEEATHATLAFRIARFLVERDPRAAERARELADHAHEVELPAAAEEHCLRLGVLDERTQRTVQAMGMRDVVMPVLREITRERSTKDSRASSTTA